MTELRVCASDALLALAEAQGAEAQVRALREQLSDTSEAHAADRRKAAAELGLRAAEMTSLRSELASAVAEHEQLLRRSILHGGGRFALVLATGASRVRRRLYTRSCISSR